MAVGAVGAALPCVPAAGRGGQAAGIPRGGGWSQKIGPPPRRWEIPLVIPPRLLEGRARASWDQAEPLWGGGRAGVSERLCPTEGARLSAPWQGAWPGGLRGSALLPWGGLRSARWGAFRAGLLSLRFSGSQRAEGPHAAGSAQALDGQVSSGPTAGPSP